MEIIVEINKRFLEMIRSSQPNMEGKLTNTCIIDDSNPHKPAVRMANLCVVSSHTVNGVALLHSNILKDELFQDYYSLWPEKFQNKTNGITPRRWLRFCSPELRAIITKWLKTSQWVTNLDLLSGLRQIPDNGELQREWASAKMANKVRLAQYIFQVTGVKHAAYWSQIVDAISCIDVLLAFAISAKSSNGSTCRPFLVTSEVENNILGGRKEGSILSIKGLWHPYAAGGQGGVAVPNDVDLGNNGEHDCSRAMLLTGPNMGGKSTLLRATCLTVIMAQLGCYVPCESCVLSPADIIFTRLGASDRIMSGESTFLVECMEAASVLRYATHDSLVVLDELGRGTSTFDGYAIAYAVFRHMVETKDCRLLFATHYHPLTKEFSSHPCVTLKHMACSFEANSNIVSKKAVNADNSCLSSDYFETERQLVFLYKLRSGASPESYGLQVALLAGMPKSVVKAAFHASKVMKSQLSNSFKSSELRAEFSTIHEQWLRTILGTSDNKSLCNNLEVTTEDAYDTLVCVWHELQKFSFQS